MPKLAGFFEWRQKIAVDFGTSTTRVGVVNKGIIFTGPTKTAGLKKPTGGVERFLAFGKRAAQMEGKHPPQIVVSNPLLAGIIADFDAAVAFLEYALSFAFELPHSWRQFLPPAAIVGVPGRATEVERRAVYSAGLKAGLGKVLLVEKPILAAIGAGIDLERSGGFFLIDIGGGTTELAVLSLGGVVVRRSLKIGGKQMDEAVVNFLRLKHGIVIGQPTAEAAKIQIGSLRPTGKNKKTVVRGRDLNNGLPKSLRVTEEEVREAIVPVYQQILQAAIGLLEETPPELMVDIAKRGVVVVGGGAQVFGLTHMFSEKLKIPIVVPSAPQEAVIRGGLRLWQKPKLLNRVKLVAGLR